MNITTIVKKYTFHIIQFKKMLFQNVKVMLTNSSVEIKLLIDMV